MPLSKWPETIALQGKHARIMPLRSIHLGNTGEKLLLWSDRHCCLCKKACGIDIVVHHIKSKKKSGSNKEDNGIPLCYECHARVEHYNPSHPLGTSYRHKELKRRREQVFEEYTSHLVPHVHYEITQRRVKAGDRKLPDVGFRLEHRKGSYPARIGVCVAIQVHSKRFDVSSKYYSGSRLWHLNPGTKHHGHFDIPSGAMKEFASANKMTAIVDITIKDPYDRSHDLLPVAWTIKDAKSDWFFEPSPPKLRRSKRRQA